MKKLIIVVLLLCSLISSAEKQFAPWNYNAIIMAHTNAEGIPLELQFNDQVLFLFLSALSAKASPIIISSSIFYKFLSIRKRWHDHLVKKDKESVKSVVIRFFYTRWGSEDHFETEFLRYAKNRESILRNIVAAPRAQRGTVMVKAKEDLDKIFNSMQAKTPSSIKGSLGHDLDGLTWEFYALECICGLIPFNDSEWEVYTAPSEEDWIVLIPTLYKRKLAFETNNGYLEGYLKKLHSYYSESDTEDNKKYAEHIIHQLNLLLLKDEGMLLGLRLNDLKKHLISDLVKSPNLINPNKKINVDNLFSLFIPNSAYATAGRWSIYLVGHGSMSEKTVSKKFEPLLAQEKVLDYWEKFLTYRKNLISSGEPVILDQKDIDFFNQRLREIDKDLRFEFLSSETLESILRKENIVEKARRIVYKRFDDLYAERKKSVTTAFDLDTSAKIAGIDLNSFQKLLTFCDTELSINFLLYVTCFGGGYHLSRPYFELIKSIDAKTKEILDAKLEKKSLHFAIMSAATTDISIINSAEKIYNNDFRGEDIPLIFSAMDKGWPMLVSLGTGSPLSFIRACADFKNMFAIMNSVFDQKKGSLPIDNIWEKLVSTFNPRSIVSIESSQVQREEALTYIPSIRFPGTGFFQVVGMPQHVDILNYSRVQAKTLDFKKNKKSWELNKKAALVYVPFVEIPIILKQSDKMIPKIMSMAPGAGLHYFDEITAPSADLENFLMQAFVFSDTSDHYGSPKLFVIKNLILKYDDKETRYSNVLILIWHAGDFQNKTTWIAWDSERNLLVRDDVGPLAKKMSLATIKSKVDEILSKWLIGARLYPQPNSDVPFQTDPEKLVAQVKKSLFKEAK